MAYRETADRFYLRAYDRLTLAGLYVLDARGYRRSGDRQMAAWSLAMAAQIRRGAERC